MAHLVRANQGMRAMLPAQRLTQVLETFFM
jgi:hypothetical protein